MTRWWDGYGLVVIEGDYAIRLVVKTSWGFDYDRAVRPDYGYLGNHSVWFEEGKVGMRLV